MDERVKLFLAYAAAVTTLWALLQWIVRHQPRRQVFEVLKEAQAEYDDLLFIALDRNPRNRDTYRNYTERVFVDVFAEYIKFRDLAETTRDRVLFLEEALNRMGTSLAKDVAQAMRESTESNKQQTAVMRDMQTELRKLSDAYIRLESEVTKWDGHDRRSHPR